MSKQRVTNEELSAILRDVEADSSPASEADGYTFHRIQNGYPADGIPRAVFVHADEEPCGVPMPPASAPLLLLVGRLAADLQQTRGQRDAFKDHLKIAEERNTKLEGVLRRIVTAWRANESDQIVSEVLIEEAEKLLDIEPTPLAAKKWNTCPKCKNSVDVDGVFDGSEVRCLGCRTVLVVVECEGDVWRLDVQDDDVQDDEEAEKIFDMDSTPDPLAAESAEPAR